jgi:ActD protein
MSSDDDVEVTQPGPSLHPRAAPHTYGVIAEFADPDALVTGIKRTREAGYSIIEAYTPYPIEEVWEAIGHPKSKVPLLVLIGGVIGCIGGYYLQYWVSVVTYPLNIGGRPFHSWPAFIPATFECTVLVAGLFAVFGMLILNGLPMPYHPVFTVPRFALATRDRYFLMILARDRRFEPRSALEFLSGLEGATYVTEVED